MTDFDTPEILYVLFAFFFQSVLIAHFALRKWRFAFAIRHGWLVYALSLPALCISSILFWNSKGWSFWISGIIFLIWGIFGYIVEYVKKIDWRTPIRWPIFGPYLLLYLGTTMFYWFPLALLWKPMWYVYAVLFVISAWLNVASHINPLVE